MRETRGRFGTRRLVSSLVVAAVAGGVLASGVSRATTAGAGATVPPAEPAESLPPPLPYHPVPGDRVVVFAAHPDDETLGAGGFIHAAVTAGARVTIVFFTNGDGYIEGVDVGFHTLFSTPARFVQYGRARQQEALAAAAQLGVSAANVVFLGYPDRGLAVLWGPAWDCRRPYLSPYTHRDRSPYPLTLDPSRRYCGDDVLADVIALLRRERPAAVVVHHPEDTHRDHWAADAFVTAALERLALEGEPWTRTVRVYHYLVHHGAWPAPRTYAPDLYLWPPRDLPAGDPAWWVEAPLAQPDEDAKRRAVLEYRSQVRLLRAYLLSFVRRNDLFDLSPPVHPSAVDTDLPLAAQEVWDRLPPTVHAARHASLLGTAEGSAILDAVAVARSPHQLLLAVRLRRPAIREVEYRVEMRLFYPAGRAARLLLRFRAPRALAADRHRPGDLPLPQGVAARSIGPRIDIVVPMAALDDPASLYLRVLTVGPLRAVVDYTPWTLVRLSRGRGAAGARRASGALSGGDAQRARAPWTLWK